LSANKKSSQEFAVLLRGIPCGSPAGKAGCAVCVAGALVLRLLRIGAQRTRHHDVFGWVAVDKASGDDLIWRNIVPAGK
jgi:hypothetical protein